MYRITEIALPLDGQEQELRALAAKRLHVEPERVCALSLVKKSVDARKKNDVRFICTVECEVSGPKPRVKDPRVKACEPVVYQLPEFRPLQSRPVIAGAGPAGLFAALILAQAGQRPILIERGSDVDARTQQVERFWRSGVLDSNTNVQFGEGGAGAFSDGKLNTGIKDPRMHKVLQEFVNAGAPREICWEALPHVGTDRLCEVVKNLRASIISLGGEVRFHTCLTDLRISDGVLKAVQLNGGQWLDTNCLILAVGHSARDTFRWLNRAGIPMEQKAFSLGARIEHLQAEIDRAQYGGFAGHPALGAAPYKLAVHLENGRGVYTFCMCPGGQVVAAASEEGRVVTNGMSYYARDGINANAALLVWIGPADFDSEHPLAGMFLQEKIEEQAFRVAGGGYRAPVQRVGDFMQRRVSTGFGAVLPTYRPGVAFASLDAILPQEVAGAMRQGLLKMNARLRGFAHPDALLTGPETRSSSPVRFLRGADCQSLGCRGLYPCGEGAGWAGGITSAAVDGIRCAEAVLRNA